MAVLAEAEESISFFRSGNDLMAVSINGDERDFLSPSYPNIARIFGNSCRMLGGEEVLPPYGRLTLNFDEKKRWGTDWSSPAADGPPNEGRRVVAGAGVTRRGIPWILMWASKRTTTLGAIEIFGRTGDKWSLLWSKVTHLESIVAAADSGDASTNDIVGFQGTPYAIRCPVASYVHRWSVRQSEGMPFTVSHDQTALACRAQPDEIAAFGGKGILGVDVDPDSQLVIEHIAATSRTVTRDVHRGLFESWTPWTVQATAPESFILWRIGQPALHFQQKGPQYAVTVANNEDGRVEHFLAAVPMAKQIAVLANGRPVALVARNNKWQLVSDEPVQEPCKFPWHKERPRHKWPGWQ
ncbi:MAG: hypothetical protein QM784_02035 [Polyangiaceae bacterium]